MTTEHKALQELHSGASVWRFQEKSAALPKLMPNRMFSQRVFAALPQCLIILRISFHGALLCVRIMLGFFNFRFQQFMRPGVVSHVEEDHKYDCHKETTMPIRIELITAIHDSKPSRRGHSLHFCY